MILEVIGIFILLCVLGFIGYKAYEFNQNKQSKSYYNQHIEIIKDTHDLRSKYNWTSGLPTGDINNDYTVTFLLKINNDTVRNIDNEKIILIKGTQETGFNPKIYLNSTAYELIVETELIGDNNTDTYQPVQITFNENNNEEQNKNQCESSGPNRVYRGDNKIYYQGCGEAKCCELTENFANVSYGIQSNNIKNIIEQFQAPILANQEHFYNQEATTQATNQGETTQASNITTQSSLPTNSYKTDKAILKGIPLQKIIHISVVFFNNIIDIYMNGKLMSSKVLDGYPKPNQQKLTISPDKNIIGLISRLKFHNQALNQDEIYNIYKEDVGFNETADFFDPASDFFENLFEF